MTRTRCKHCRGERIVRGEPNGPRLHAGLIAGFIWAMTDPDDPWLWQEINLGETSFLRCAPCRGSGYMIGGKPSDREIVRL